jgi:hypothetical protein
MAARTLLVILALTLLIGRAPALAQQTEDKPLDPNLRSVDLGVRFGSVDGDEARFMRYRDLRDGVILDSGRYTRDKDTRLFHAEVDHLGYRDQRYSVRFEQF